MQKNIPLPDAGFVRLPAVLSVFPVAKSTWWAMVRDGRAPKPVKLGPRTSAWRATDIKALLDRFDKDAPNGL